MYRDFWSIFQRYLDKVILLLYFCEFPLMALLYIEQFSVSWILSRMVFNKCKYVIILYMINDWKIVILMLYHWKKIIYNLKYDGFNIQKDHDCIINGITKKISGLWNICFFFEFHCIISSFFFIFHIFIITF